MTERYQHDRRKFKTIHTLELALEFDKRIQNSGELIFVSDDLLSSLLEGLETEELRRQERAIVGRRIVRRIFKRQYSDQAEMVQEVQSTNPQLHSRSSKER